MNPQEAANLILDIFQRTCTDDDASLTNKQLHVAYFKKNGSGLGFFEGVHWLLKKKWLEPVEGVEHTHRMTKAGRAADV